jgi:hypothetical protein
VPQGTLVFSQGAATAIVGKARYISAVESPVDLGSTSHQNQKANDFGVISWSEWQDSNLRPLRPERPLPHLNLKSTLQNRREQTQKQQG